MRGRSMVTLAQKGRRVNGYCIPPVLLILSARAGPTFLSRDWIDWFRERHAVERRQ